MCYMYRPKASQGLEHTVHAEVTTSKVSTLPLSSGNVDTYDGNKKIQLTLYSNAPNQEE